MTKQHRKPRRKVTEVPQPSDPTQHVSDEAVNEEMDDSLERAATTATSLDVEQDISNIINTQSKATPNEPESSDDNEYLGEDASKQGRISDINADEGITLVSTHDDAEMFDADQDLYGEEVFVAKQYKNVVEKEVDAIQVQVRIATTTLTILIDEATLAQALAELKHAKPRTKVKGVVFHEPEESTTTITTTIPKPKSQDKDIDRENVETLWKLVKAKHGSTRPEEEYERVLWGDLKLKVNAARHKLTTAGDVYTSCIEQFWATVKAKTINGKVQLQVLVDGKKVIITESIIRRDLQLEDIEDVDCLPNAVIFEQLTLMGVLDLETTKTTQALKINSFKRRVKKLEKKQRSRTHKLKRLYKVGLTARLEFSDDNQYLGEDTSKQGRISDIDADEGVTLVSTHDDAEMFNVDQDLHGEEVFVAKQDKNVVEKEVDVVQVQVSATATTLIISIDEATLAQALTELKHVKPKAKAKGIVFHIPEESTTTITTAIPKLKS
uniref:Xylulose kinase-1 n=1 Tax=Tanacetum cinerariifolium TaxID=118510 RepID=A0A6L2M315_TANCI|nr:hypothetical protein [Tanacetum cinerariifolium]